MDSSLLKGNKGSCVLALGFNILFLLFCLYEGEGKMENCNCNFGLNFNFIIAAVMKQIKEIKGKCYKENCASISLLHQVGLFTRDVWRTFVNKWTSKN